MGEYARFYGEEIKIGTCEDLYYLRHDQRHLVCGYQFDDSLRYRFPWPDEDGEKPGSFDRYNRSVSIHGMKAPAELSRDHNPVQFVAAAGYLTSLPCPESTGAPDGLGPIEVNGLRIHRNGFRGKVRLCQQRVFEGKLVAIVECGGCGLKWRLSPEDAITAAAILREEAKRHAGSETWYTEVADRLLSGYKTNSSGESTQPAADTPGVGAAIADWYARLSPSEQYE